MKYIIDGYNLLKHPLFNSYLRDNTEDTVKAIVTALKVEAGINFIIVFDGKFDVPPDMVNFVKTSGREKDADTYIVNYLLKEGVFDKVVVTNDVHLQMRVKSIGGKVLKLEEFFSRVNRKKSRKKQREYLKDGIDRKTKEDIDKEALKWFGIE